MKIKNYVLDVLNATLVVAIALVELLIKPAVATVGLWSSLTNFCQRIDALTRQWRYIPWMTISLFAVVWLIHLVVPIVSDRDSVRDTYGIHFGDYHTYLTYAVLHVDLQHIIGNSLTLVFFGIWVEFQIGRRLFGITILICAIAGVLGALILHTLTGLETDAGLIGSSAVTCALSVMGISILARFWRQRTTWLLKDKVFHLIVPICIVASRLGIDLAGFGGLYYPVAGHLAGSIAGTILILLMLNGRTATPETTTLIETIKGWITAIKDKKRTLTLSWSNRNKAGEVLELIGVTIAIAGSLIAVQSM